MDEIDKLEVKSDVLEIILKLVFNLPAEDFAVTVRKVLIQWRNMKSDEDIVRYEKNAPRTVMKVWKNYNWIQRMGNREVVAKISRRIRLVKLYLDYRHVKMEIAGGTIKVESMSRRMEGKAMVISPDCRGRLT